MALIFILLFLPNFPANKASKIDLKGALLSPFAFPILIYGVHIGADKGWSNPSAIAFMSVGLLMLLLFILVELRVENPLLHLLAFTIPEFTKGISLMWLNQIVVFGAMLLVPLYLQNIVGLSSVNTGLMMVPQAIASFLGMTIGGRVFDKFGTKASVLPSFTLGGISLILFAQTSPHSSLTFTLCAIVLLGLSQGLVNMQVNNHALQAVPMKNISRVTPLTNEMMQVVNSFAIAFLTAFLSSQIKNQSSLSPLQANLTAFHHTFWLLLIFVSVGFISSLFLRKK
nr:MFS transporter [Lactococcus cremoris]